MNRPNLALLALAPMLLAGLGACSGKPEAAAARATSSDAPLLLAAADLVRVERSGLATGPAVTGSIQAEKKADLRAEVGAVVLAVLKESGEAVHRGDLLVRLDDTAIRDALTAAQAAAQSATNAYDQAERQYQRMHQLRASGLVSLQQEEDAEVRRNSARSDAEAARTRVVSARQQLDRTQVRAPFDGIVTDRKVSAGDTVQVARELIKVIDPQSLRFEGFIPAGSIGEVRPGQNVVFRVQGQGGGSYPGRVSRVNPEADAATRQVGVLVTFTDAEQRPRVAGLYAEGRIETAPSASLTLPPTAIQRDGDQSFVWRREGNLLRKTGIQLGERDLRSGLQAVAGGLGEGTEVLRHPDSTLHDGQAIELGADPKPAGG
jgi:RND family efflux transporter MFP subunit